MGRQTHTPIEKLRNELAKSGASIKTTHTESPKGTTFWYAEAIMKALEYRKQVTQLYATWTFTNTTESATYDPIIRSSTVNVTKAYN